MPRSGWLTLGPTGNWQITDDNSGETQIIDATAIDVILPIERYQSIVDHVAGPFQDWTGTAGLGYSIQRGDQQNDTFTSTVDARRERPSALIFERHWRTNVHMTSLLTNAQEAETSIGSNTFSMSVRQDRMFAPGTLRLRDRAGGSRRHRRAASPSNLRWRQRLRHYCWVVAARSACSAASRWSASTSQPVGASGRFNFCLARRSGCS